MSKSTIIAVMLVLVAACRTEESPMGKSTSSESRTELEELGKRLSMELPAGTRIIHVETHSGLDDAIFAKLRIPAGRAVEFVQSLRVTEFQTGAADLFGRDRGPWDPHQAKGLRVVDVPLASTRGLVVGVDDGSTGALIVYVLNHGT
jgi:hypothetical protein